MDSTAMDMEISARRSRAWGYKYETLEIQETQLVFIASVGYDLYVMRSYVGGIFPGAGVADLHWKDGISDIFVFDRGRVFPYI